MRLVFRLGAKLEPVSRNELATLFWPEIDDSAARQNLRRLLSFVRHDLPEQEALLSTSEFVAFSPKHVWSDSDSLLGFSNQDSVAGWQAVERLYTGSFLSGFSLRNNAEFELWQSALEERIRTRALDALAKLVDHNTETGDYPAAVKYARRYLEIDIAAETIHRQLIILYARLGERELALHQFEMCVLVLERELGVDPLPETHAAYTDALQSRTSPAFASTAPKPSCAILPRLELPLTGHGDRQQRLAAAYAHLSQGGYIFVSGESGVGKSRLLKTFAAQQNALVLFGYCQPGSKALPYYPLVEALRRVVPNPDLVLNTNPLWLAEIARLVPEMFVLYPDVPCLPAPNPTNGPAQLFEALVSVLCNLAAKQQVMLCLEELQWADQDTIAWLRYAAARLCKKRVCILVSHTSRLDESLLTFKADLARTGLMVELNLEALDVNAVAEIQRIASPTRAQDEFVAHRLQQATGGNPLPILELVRELRDNCQLDGPPHSLPLPHSVQRNIERRVELLGALAKQVLEAAAVLNPQLDFDLLRATTGRTTSEVMAGIEELVEHQLLHNTKQGPRVLHNLVQQSIYCTLSVGRRRLLHRRAAKGLLCSEAYAEEYRYAAAAAHLAAAGEERRAAGLFLRASIAAQQYSSPAMAVEYAEQGLASLGPSPGSSPVLEMAAELHEALGDGLLLLGRPEMALNAYEAAHASLNSADLQRRTALLCKRAGVLVLSTQFGQATELLRTALEQVSQLL